jgi:quinolinate synthase
MKRNTLEKAVATLGEEWDDAPAHQVVVPEPIRARALTAVERMLG